MRPRNRRSTPRSSQSLRAYVIDVGDATNNVLPLDLMVEGQTIDISQHGLQIETGCALSLGSYVIAVVFTDERRSISFCKVMWKKRSGATFRYGLYFKEWSHLDSKLSELLPEMVSFFDLFRRVIKNPTVPKAA